jgi:hypothetical protein
VYGSYDAKGKFVKDFVGAWTKVMNADRFDQHVWSLRVKPYFPSRCRFAGSSRVRVGSASR